MAFAQEMRVLSRNLLARMIRPHPLGWPNASVLCFHDICQHRPSDIFSVEIGRFKAQLSSVKRMCPHVLGVDSLIGPVIPNCLNVALSFDDGYDSTYTLAAPILDSLGWPFVVCVTTGFLNRPGYLTESALRDLATNPLVQIASHGVSHQSLVRKSRDNIEEELRVSKLEIERITGRKTEWLAYPFGHVNGEIKDVARGLGYIGALGTEGTRVRVPVADLYNIPRLTVCSVDHASDVLAKIRGQHDWIPSARQFVRALTVARRR